MNLIIKTTVSFSLFILMVAQGLAFYPWQNKKDKGESTSTLDRVGGQRSASFSQDDNKAQMKLTAPIKLTTQGINRRGAHYSSKKLDSTESGRLFGREFQKYGKLPTLDIDIKPILKGQAISNFNVVLEGKIINFSGSLQLRGEKKGNTWKLNLSMGDEVRDTKNILVKESANSQKVTIEMNMQEFQDAGFKSLDKVTVYTYKLKSTVELRPKETRLQREDLRDVLAHGVFDIQGSKDGKWYSIEPLDIFRRPDPTFKSATHYEFGIVPIKGSKNPPTSIIEVTGEKGTLFVKVTINKKNEISVSSGGDLKNLKENKYISSLSRVTFREDYEFDVSEDTKVASILIPKRLMFRIAGEQLTQYKITAQVPDIQIRGRHRAFGPPGY